MDFVDKRNIRTFLKDTIEKFILSLDMIRDIYLYIATNYKDISENAIKSIINFLTKNKEKLNADAIIFLLENIEDKIIIKSLLNNLQYIVIKEEELYSQETNFESFKLLDLIQKKNLIDKCQGKKGTQYLLNTINLGEKVIKDIKNGQIKYNSFMNIWGTFEKIKNFQNKLKILFFNQEEDRKECLERMRKYYIEITRVMKVNLENILSVFSEFYKITFKDEIAQLEALKNELQSGMICEILKENVMTKLNEFKGKVNDFDSQLTLQRSLIFTHFYNNLKTNNIVKKETEIFDDTLGQFNQLKYFFKNDWINKIPDSIIKECYRALKVNFSEGEIEDTIKKELKTLAKYFKIEDFNDYDYLNLVSHLIIYNQKEDIFMTAKSCMHFIDELGVKKTEFYEELKNIRTEIKKNITVDKIKQYGEVLKKYGLTTINLNIEQKYLDILDIVEEKNNFLKFLIEIQEEDIHKLIEFVAENKDKDLTDKDIQDLIKCLNFINKLCNKKDLKTDVELIKDFVNLVLEPNNKDIKESFKGLSLKFEKIEKLLSSKIKK